MGSLLFPIVLLGIVVIFGIVFLVVTKKQERAQQGKNKNEKNSMSDSKGTDIKKEDVFKFMEFEKILDNMIIQKNGTRYTIAIKCKGINYDLMSDVEQLSIEEGFITFLNTLRSPIQIYVQAQNIDLKGAISKYKNNVESIKNEYDSINDEYNKIVEALESTDEEINKISDEKNRIANVYEYANDIIQYVERMSINKNLLQRNFYVLTSYNVSEIPAYDKFSKEELHSLCYNELLTRAQGIIGGLASCSVGGEILDSNEIADLLYTAYNRDDKSLMSIKEAIDSGFYRLYSTSKDAFDKKSEMLMKQIEEDAKLKALEAIRESLEKGEYVSPEMEELALHEDTARLALDFIKKEKIPEEIKKSAQQEIITQYKNQKDVLLKSSAIRKNGLEEEIKQKLPESEKERNISVTKSSNDFINSDKTDIANNKENVVSQQEIPKNIVITAPREEKVDNNVGLIEKNLSIAENDPIFNNANNSIFDSRDFDDNSEDDSII